MNEISSSIELTSELYKSNLHDIKAKIVEIANMCQIPSSSQDIFKYSLSFKCLPKNNCSVFKVCIINAIK